MRLLRARLLALLIAAVAALFAAAPASAQDATPTPEPEQIDNAAIAVNTEDDSSLFEFALDIRRVMNGIVDQTNAAVAYSSCDNCQTVAIAIQIVLVMGSASTVTPENLALALNEDCVACVTVAAAYQFVLGTGDRVRFTGQAMRRLREIARGFKAIEDMDGTADEINAEVKRLIANLREVLRIGIVPVHKHRDEAGEDSQQASPKAAPSPEPTATSEETATPEPTATPEETATPTETATPEVTAEPTPAG